MTIEIDRKHLREHYNGSREKLMAARDYIEGTPEHIKNCFAFGNGTEKDQREYMRNNGRYCIFVTIAE